MQLIGTLDSPYVRRTAVSARFLGLEIEHRSMSVFRNYDELKAINPLVKAPTLVCDDGTVLSDSTLIIDYFESRAGRSLMPADGAVRHRALRLIGIALVAMDKTKELYCETGVRPAEFVWPDWDRRLSEQLSAAFHELDAELDAGSGDTWLCGDAVTQVDISVAVAWAFTQLMFPERVVAGEFPTLTAHATRAEALPEFLAVPIDG